MGSPLKQLAAQWTGAADCYGAFMGFVVHLVCNIYRCEHFVNCMFV